MRKVKKTEIRKEKAITLIALVITIIVLLILAGVSIAMLTGENGILNQATKAKEETEKAKQKELANLDKIEDYITENTNGNYIKTKGVNSPKLVSGMSKIMFTEPSESEKGKTIKDGENGFDTSNWFDYKSKKWANVMTEDGSMWVWIPRYAYKITYNNASDKSQGGTIDVKFLIGTSDQYYEGNELKTAKRATSKDEVVDTTSDYYVHPAFTNESSIGYANGGWDKELTGIWVAKFEAGYASGNNNAPVKASSKNYSQTTSYVLAIETGTSNTVQTARNWLDGIYGETATAIKYPTFQGTTYSMNYINQSDTFNISKALTEDGNIYGFNSSSTDSHLMKNSEWGAIAYLSYSQYGTNGNEISINNISLNSGNQRRTQTEGKSGVDSVYAVTGITTGSIDGTETISTIDSINKINGNMANSDGVYTWNQKNGQRASSSGTIYGIYDLSGGTWEETAGYIANENENLKKYGASFSYEENTLNTESTKYTTVYKTNMPESNELDTASNENYKKNTNKYGDAIHEISGEGIGKTAWNNDYSKFMANSNPFLIRGGYLWAENSAGLFYFVRNEGKSHSGGGFRVLLAIN